MRLEDTECDYVSHFWSWQDLKVSNTSNVINSFMLYKYSAEEANPKDRKEVYTTGECYNQCNGLNTESF